ncbi:MAG: hypothetical protein O7I93_07485 [Gemmatimonadetes bacterium]|nr:hypothetical protein [Gemmatimonadota bacterium]
MLLLANLDQIIHDVIRSPFSIPLAAIIFGCAGWMVCGLSSAVSKVLVARGQERTRRELAAYVAEGTLDPDQAVAMLNAGRSKPVSTDRDVQA